MTRKTWGRFRQKLRDTPTPFAAGAFGLATTAYIVWSLRGDALYSTTVVLLAVIAWGLVTTAWTLYDTWQERRWAREQRPNDRAVQRIAGANVRREIIRVVKLAAFFQIALGLVIGLNIPQANRTLLILIVLLMVANSVLDRLERRQTQEDLDRPIPYENMEQ